MSGNVKEWVLTTGSTTGAAELRGGAYNTASFTGRPDDVGAGPAVRRVRPRAPDPLRLPSVGFRCCLPGMLPP